MEMFGGNEGEKLLQIPGHAMQECLVTQTPVALEDLSDLVFKPIGYHTF